MIRPTVALVVFVVSPAAMSATHTFHKVAEVQPLSYQERPAILPSGAVVFQSVEDFMFLGGLEHVSPSGTRTTILDGSVEGLLQFQLSWAPSSEGVVYVVSPTDGSSNASAAFWTVGAGSTTIFDEAAGIGGVDSIATSPGGTVAFWGAPDPSAGGGGTSLFRTTTSGGVLERIAGTADGYESPFLGQRIAVNDAGLIASRAVFGGQFTSELLGFGGPGAPFSVSGPPASIDSGFSQPGSISSSGAVAMFEFVNAPPLAEERRLVVTDGTAHRVVASSLDGVFTAFSTEALPIEFASGDVAFVGITASGRELVYGQEDGLFQFVDFSTAGLDLGSSLTSWNVSGDTSGGGSGAPHSSWMNDSGQFVFVADLADGTRWIVRAEPVPTPAPLLLAASAILWGKRRRP